MSDIVGQIALELNLDSGKFKKSLKNLNKTANDTARSMTNSFSGAFKKVAVAATAAFSVKAVVDFGRSYIKTANEVENAWIGLNSIVNGQGKSFDAAKKFIQDYISDGLVPLKDAVIAYKNLSLRGYSEEQIQAVMIAFKNSATYARQSQYSLGEAISTATEGLKNENSIVVDNAGVTKNVAKMWQDYAKSIGVSSTSLTKQQKIEAEVAGIIAETKYQMGDAARYANTYSGKIAKLNASFTNLKVKIGNILKVVVNVFIPAINSAVNAIDKLVDKFIGALNFLGVQTNITDTLQSISDTAEASNTGIEDTTKSAQKLKKALAGFDQLNILSAESSSSNDSSSSDSTPTTTVPSTSTNLKSDENAYNKFGDTVKKVFDKINKATEPVRKSLSKLKEQFDRLGKFAWEGLKDFYKDFLKPIGKWVLGEGLPRLIDALTKMLGNIDWGGKINTALDELWKALEPFAENIGEGLLWFWENVLTPLGTWTMNEVVPVFLGILADALKVLNKIIEKLKPTFNWLWENFLKPIAKWTGGVIVTVLNAIGDALNWIAGNEYAIDIITALGVAIGTAFAVSKIVSFIKNLQLAKKVVTAFTGVQKALNSVLNANPFGVIVVAVTAVVTAITWLWNNCEWFREGWTTVWNGICSVAETVWNAITGFFTSAWDNICAVWNAVVGFFQGIWDGICNVFNAVVSWFSDLFTNAWNGICNAWSSVTNFFSGIWSGIQGAFSAVGTWFSDIFTNAWNGIKNAFSSVTSFFKGIWDGIKGAFSAVTNWFGDTFSKAWSAVKNVFSIGGQIFNGIKDGILNAFKFVVNGIIDGLNWVIAQPFNGINGALRTIKSLDFWGWKPFDWLGEIPVPQIPKLAKGGLVSAPTLALVGDNKNAHSDPEVISPLSKLKGMIAETQQTTVCDERIIRMLQKIYDLLSNQETQYTNVIYLDSEEIERKLVKVRKRKTRRYGGTL